MGNGEPQFAIPFKPALSGYSIPGMRGETGSSSVFMINPLLFRQTES